MTDKTEALRALIGDDDLLRRAQAQLGHERVGISAETCRHRASESRGPVLTIDYLLRAAVLEAELPPPPVQVGHLALTPNGVECEVRFIDADVALVRYTYGTPLLWSIVNLTYSRPKPEGWGQP